ncbi:hypothetical protein FCOIX_11504 [Fusarium coicis]|nr:hypothetical protein FCOIX_11504 [Fusarium coicis]
MDKKGHSAAGKQVRVSAKINCTTEKAREDGPPMNQCDNDRYKMGIIVNSTVNATISDKANLLEIVRDAADPATARSVNLNRTLVIPFTNPQRTVENGSTGYWAFLPELHCWNGVLKDCKGDDEDWDGEVVVACGYKILSRGANASTAEYDGQVSFVEEYVAKYSKSDEEDRPWPEYETAVEWVEEHKEDSDSGALNHASAYSARMALICFSLTVLLFYI